jgi:hypothetical protein
MTLWQPVLNASAFVFSEVPSLFRQSGDTSPIALLGGLGGDQPRATDTHHVAQGQEVWRVL